MMITDAIISPLFKNLINRSGLHRLYLLFCWSGHVSTLGFPKSFTHWSKSSRYLVRVLRHSLLKHRSTSFTVNMHIFTSFFYTFMYTHMSYATKFNHKNQDEIFSAFVCFLFIFLFCFQTCTKARFAGNDLATCRNSITDLARRSCCLQATGVASPKLPWPTRFRDVLTGPMTWM